MNCADVCRLLAEGRPPGKDARSHIESCGVCSVLGGPLEPLTESPDATRIEAYKRIALDGLRKVKPLPSDRQLTSTFIALFLCFAVSACFPVGFYGLHALSAVQMVFYFGVILATSLFASSAVVQEMTPGSRRYIDPGKTVAIGVFAVALIVFLLFRSFDMTRFVQRGEGCLKLGLECAAASALIFAFLMKDGWFTSPTRAGAMAGFLAGLTGFGVLAMHCSLLTTPHIMVWHFAVVPISILMGAAIGYAIQNIRRLRNF